MTEPAPRRASSLVEMPAILDYLLRVDNVPDEPIVQRRLKLSDILPKKQWWRIYLDRMDHPKAILLEDPGLLYDTQKSPGFEESMTNAYEQVLEGDQFSDNFAGESFAPDIYDQFYKLVTKNVTIKPRDPRVNVSFGLEPGRPASDAKEDEILGRYLMDLAANLNDPEEVIAMVMKAVPNGSTDAMVCVAMEICDGFVAAGFARFTEYITQAQTRKAQLRAIAQLIRFLHVLHKFSDGNGRLNVHFLLPRLLLQYGFGPPLRLGAYCSPDTVFGLFNGCFTLDQIVVFLWHSQQLAGQEVEDLDLAKVTHW